MITFLFHNHPTGDKKKWSMERKKERAEESKETDNVEGNGKVNKSRNRRRVRQ
jgi:hypothetical protein